MIINPESRPTLKRLAVTLRIIGFFLGTIGTILLVWWIAITLITGCGGA